MLRKRYAPLVLFVLVTCILARPTLCQSTRTAAVTGAVFEEQSRRPIVGAIVTLTRLQRETQTDAYGVFQIGDVPDGSYELTVKKLGYQETSIRIRLTRSDTLRQMV